MSKKMNFIVPLMVYPFDVMASIGQSDGELKKDLAKYNIEWNDNFKIVGKGRFIMTDKNQSLIRLLNYPDTNEMYGFLQHEIFHCVTHIMNRIGMKFKLHTSDEAYSYLVGYLTEKIYDKL